MSLESVAADCARGTCQACTGYAVLSTEVLLEQELLGTPLPSQVECDMQSQLGERCLEGKAKRDKPHSDGAVPLSMRKVRVTCISTTPRLREFAVKWAEGVANAAVCA